MSEKKEPTCTVQSIQKGPEPAFRLQLQQVLEEQGGSFHGALVVFLSLDELDHLCNQKPGQVSSLQNHSSLGGEMGQPLPPGLEVITTQQKQLWEAADSAHSSTHTSHPLHKRVQSSECALRETSVFKTFEKINIKALRSWQKSQWRVLHRRKRWLD